VVRGAAPGVFARVGEHRFALAGAVSGEWGAAKHAGIPKGLGLQGGAGDGEGECLPRVVTELLATSF
jgi:hypothetical protein